VGTVNEARCDAADAVIVATKSQDTLSVLRELERVAPSELPVACAQNGVENERVALRMFPNVYGILVMCPASHLTPGQVAVHATPVWGVLDVGRWPGSRDDGAVALATCFGAAGFLSDATADIALLKWAKLMSNLGNAVEALFVRDEDAATVLKLVRAEGHAVLAAMGIDIERGEALLIGRATTYQHQPAGTKRGGGSSWQSLARGAGEIESDFLNGEISLLGRLHHVPTPANEALRVAANRGAADAVTPGSLHASVVLDQLH
jgi:2-dehydropantoate 2-reductase